MGNSCSCLTSGAVVVEPPRSAHDGFYGENGAEEQHAIHHCPDPIVYDLVRRNNPNFPPPIGQHHLLYKKGKPPVDLTQAGVDTNADKSQLQSTRLVVRNNESSHSHIYAIRSTESSEQRPPEPQRILPKPEPDLSVDPYLPQNMRVQPLGQVKDWVCVSEEFDIYICDTGLTYTECNALVQTTEQVCKGQYAAYTYAKQTLGCREFPTLAHACWDPVHRVTHSIWSTFPSSLKLQLDDREPHIVKYDVTKKERQKLDMHTDKSEWTFLIALSDGCGLDYEGGGTFFEALDATVHLQRGHALIFPGKLRHCGQRITKGLRFLLVGFLVDKANQQQTTSVSVFNKDPVPTSPDPDPQV